MSSAPSSDSTGSSHRRRDVHTRPPVAPGWVLAAAIVGISFAAPLVRTSDAHAITIAFWRLGLALLPVAVALGLTREWRQWRALTRLEWILALLAGLALAGHFWAWNVSVHLTTVAASVTLVSLQPAIVAVLSAVYLRERPEPIQLVGITIAISGAVLIALPGLLTPAGGDGPENPTLGNVLAAFAAVLAAVYYVLGRRLRRALGIWSYVAVVYSVCFLALGALAAALQVEIWPQPQREWLVFAGLALGPMILGHTGMNWALRYRPAYAVNVTVLAEPIGASLLAAFLPWIAEVPPTTTIVGGLIVLGGILLASWRR
jgi:drug/metabolite transporter (DMT)-like permease